MTSISHEQFVQAVEPIVVTMRALVDAYLETVRRTGGSPDADSPAVAEIAAEGPMVCEAWPQPTQTAHSAAGILTFAGVDHVRSFAHLFQEQPVPVYSHMVVARAALESFGRVAWLCEPNLSAADRVKRWAASELRSCKYLKALPQPLLKERATRNIDTIRVGGKHAGWNVQPNAKGGACIDDVLAPGLGAAMGHVINLGEDVEWSDPVKRALSWYLSGMVHADTFALMQSVQDSGLASPMAGTAIAAISTDSQGVHVIGSAVATGAVRGCGSYMRLMGWHSEEWDQAVKECQEWLRFVARSQDLERAER